MPADRSQPGGLLAHTLLCVAGRASARLHQGSRYREGLTGEVRPIGGWQSERRAEHRPQRAAIRALSRRWSVLRFSSARQSRPMLDVGSDNLPDAVGLFLSYSAQWRCAPFLFCTECQYSAFDLHGHCIWTLAISDLPVGRTRLGGAPLCRRSRGGSAD